MYFSLLYDVWCCWWTVSYHVTLAQSTLKMVAFIQFLFWLVWKLFLCFIPDSPNHSVFSMLAKYPNFYSCKSVCKIVKQPHVWHIHFNLPAEITHPAACCILPFFLWAIVLSSPIVTFPLETHPLAHWGRNYSIYASHIFVKTTNDVNNHAARYEGAATAWWSEKKPLWDLNLRNKIQFK